MLRQNSLSDQDKTCANFIFGQLLPQGVTNPVLLVALRHVDRRLYLPPMFQTFAYSDRDLRVPTGRALLRPAYLARLLQAAEVQSHHRVLVVGCGYGYSVAVLAQMAKHVYAIESDDCFVQHAQAHLAEVSSVVTIVQAPLDSGLVTHAPYDLIVLEGGVRTSPEMLASQLTPHGRIVGIRLTSSVMGEGTLWQKTFQTLTPRTLFNAYCFCLPGYEDVMPSPQDFPSEELG